MRFRLVQEVSAEHFERHANDRVAFENAVRSDPRLVGMSVTLVVLFIRLALILFALWQQNGVNRPRLLIEEGRDSVPTNLYEEFSELDPTVLGLKSTTDDDDPTEAIA